jgi:hypothetical protein
MVSSKLITRTWIGLMMNLLIMWILIVLTFLSHYMHDRKCIRNHDLNSTNNCYQNEIPIVYTNSFKSDIVVRLRFNITEIYRIDVSCFLDPELDGSLAHEFNRTKKSCSLTSNQTNIDTNLKLSFSKESHSESYEPILINEQNYDPFRPHPQIERQFFRNLQPGGRYIPTFLPNSPCNQKSIDYVVFLVTFTRNRVDNLALFLLNMHSYLRRVALKFTYKIVVVEQLAHERTLFNKGRLYNAAAKFLIDQAVHEHEQIDCIVLHDVDLAPSADPKVLGEYGDYRCRQWPWHLSRQVRHMSDNRDHVYFKFLTGGVLSMQLEHFKLVNGYSNRYFGWGAEDVCLDFYYNI